MKLMGNDPDYLRRDLADAIAGGAYPKYELGVQLIAEEDEDSFDFDLLDCTKLVPEELVPIKWVGTLELNKNPTNCESLRARKVSPKSSLTLHSAPADFSETEQVAFCVSNMVSCAAVLQSKRSAEQAVDLAARRSRNRCPESISRTTPCSSSAPSPTLTPRLVALYVLRPLLSSLANPRATQGGPNFSSLPINRGVCPFISTARDGQAQHRIQAGPHYYPNRFQTPNAGKVPHGKGQNYATSDAATAENTKIDPESMTFAPYKVEGVRGRQRPAKFADDYSQAQLFYNSLSKVEQQHMVDAFAFELGHVRFPGPLLFSAAELTCVVGPTVRQSSGAGDDD